MKVYYHLIEESGYGKIGSHGYYSNRDEAEREMARLKDFFPNQTFWIYQSNSKREPEICTI